MVRIDAYQTADGAIHTSWRDAKRHAEERYGAVLTTHAHALVRLEKYAATMDYLEANLASLASLAALKADTVLTPEDDAI